LRKVLIVCKGHRNIAGAQLYLKQVCTLFPKDQYELHFCLHKKDGLRVFKEIGEEKTVRIWEYDWRHLKFWDSLVVGARLFRKVGPHLIIFNSSEDKIIAPVWTSLIAGIKRRIMVVHWAQSPDSLPIFRKKPGLPIPIPSRYSFKTRAARGISLRFLHRIIFVNNVTREAYISLYHVPKGRCCTVYNGIDVKDFLSKVSDRVLVRAKLGVQDDQVAIFAAGNLTEIKGYTYLIDAIECLKQKALPIKCFIAGQGELRGALEKKILALGLEDTVTLLDYRDDIPSLLAASDIYCMPSLNEALGYSLLEAMASGLPVIASNVGGIPEVVTYGEEGFLIPPKNSRKLADAIEHLVGNNDLRHKVGIAGRKTVRARFSIQQMLNETRKIFLNGAILND